MNFNRVFHYKPSILGYPCFWKHPPNIFNVYLQICVPKASFVTFTIDIGPFLERPNSYCDLILILYTSRCWWIICRIYVVKPSSLCSGLTICRIYKILSVPPGVWFSTWGVDLPLSSPTSTLAIVAKCPPFFDWKTTWRSCVKPWENYMRLAIVWHASGRHTANLRNYLPINEQIIRHMSNDYMILFIRHIIRTTSPGTSHPFLT